MSKIVQKYYFVSFSAKTKIVEWEKQDRQVIRSTKNKIERQQLVFEEPKGRQKRRKVELTNSNLN